LTTTERNVPEIATPEEKIDLIPRESEITEASRTTSSRIERERSIRSKERK